MHVVVSGATGFIGAAIVAELLHRKSRVTILVRPESNLFRLSGSDKLNAIQYIRFNDEEIIAKVGDMKPDVFIHCAWRGVGGSERNRSYQITENIRMTLDTVELAASTGCRQWVGLGSQAEYGNQNCRIREDAPLSPTTVYGKAKLAAGIAALALCEVKGVTGTWLRVFSTYGPGDSVHWLIPYVIQEFFANRAPALTRCEQLWDYLYVADAARAVVAVADAAALGVFNLGSGVALPLRDYIDAARMAVGTTIEPIYGGLEYRPDQVMHLEADITRLVTATGWSPQVGLREGIINTVTWEKKRLRSIDVT